MKRKVLAVLCSVFMVATCAGCGASGEPAQEAPKQAEEPVAEETTEAPAAEGETGEQTAAPSGDAFDAFARPRVVESPKVAILIRDADSEAQIRNLQQAEIEVAHRGWELVDIIYETDTNFRDAFQNVMNQNVDAIILTSTESIESKADLIQDARNKGVGIYGDDLQVIDGIICNSTMPNGIAAMEMFYKIGEDYGWNLNMATLDFDAQQICVERNEGVKALANHQGAYPQVTLLASDDPMKAVTNPGTQASYDINLAWLQKYGDELQMVWTCADVLAIPAAEAVSQNGDPNGDKCFTVGFDGGVQAWSYIRNNTPLRYSYAQPFELYTHKVFEAINDIQVKGLNPGDEGCILSKVGEVMYSTGGVISRENVPAVGTSIHSLFDYYDESDKEAWYNWTDGPGQYLVEEYAAN